MFQSNSDGIQPISQYDSYRVPLPAGGTAGVWSGIQSLVCCGDHLLVCGGVGEKEMSINLSLKYICPQFNNSREDFPYGLILLRMMCRISPPE